MTALPYKLELTGSLRNVRPAPAVETEPDFEAQLRAAYERGRRDGEDALREQLIQQRADLQAVETGVIESLRNTLPRVARDCEQALTTLAVEVAQKLVAGLPISVEMIETAIREALAQVEETTDYHIYLHPEDLELLRHVNSALLEAKEPAQRIFFHPAPEVTRGGCLVKTRFGIIDAQRETKSELLKKTLLA
jgi:flagellar assembly protein FliH